MIITLCGSARFEPLFKAYNAGLTLAGHTVFSLGAYPSDLGEKTWYSEREKEILDKVHKDKIDASDAILVLNKFAYIGSSTLSEIMHARARGKLLFSLESWGEGFGVNDSHFPHIREKVKQLGISSDGFTFSPIDTTPKSNFYNPKWDNPYGDLFPSADDPLRGKIFSLIRQLSNGLET